MHSKVLTTCVAILGAQQKTICLINEMIRMPVNKYYIRAKNRAARNINSNQLERFMIRFEQIYFAPFYALLLINV